MGLDISLYRSDVSIADLEKDDSDDGLTSREERVERPSAKYPDHLFKVGYCRSSYNGGGIESAVYSWLGVRPLEYIFEPADGYRIQPDWDAARARCVEVLEKLRAYEESPMAHYFVTECSAQAIRPDLAPKTKNDALRILSEQLDAGKDKDWRRYSNAAGDFMLDGVTVMAIMPMAEPRRFFGHGVFVIEKCKDNPVTSYRESLEITLETIDYVLAQSDKDRYLLHWSG